MNDERAVINASNIVVENLRNSMMRVYTCVMKSRANLLLLLRKKLARDRAPRRNR